MRIGVRRRTPARRTLVSLFLAVFACLLAAAAAPAQTDGYVGSELCLGCHPDKAEWRASRHAVGIAGLESDAFSLQPGLGVVADIDGNGIDDFKQGLDLNRVAPAFAPFRPYAPVLGYDPAAGYYIRIRDVTMPVRFVYGGAGGYRQLYAVQIPVADRADGLSAGRYISPVQYNELTHDFVPYQPERWYAPDGTPRISPSTTTQDLPHAVSFERNCAGCHFTYTIAGQDANGEWTAAAPPTVGFLPGDPHYIDFDGDGYRELVNIGCERCHGPGLDHVVSSGRPDRIIDPATDMDASRRIQLCGSCHAAGASLPNGIHAYPFDEAAQESPAGRLLEDLLGRFFREEPQLWPDGVHSSGFHQQAQDFSYSGKPAAGVTCTTCHAVHSAAPKQLRPRLRVPDSAGNPIEIPVRVEDNTECLACHAGRDDFTGLRPEDLLDPEGNREAIAAVVTEHTRHPYEPEGTIGLSRCTECHMAKVAWNALPYDTASHTFAVIPPTATLEAADKGGMPNSCAVRCHRQWAPVFGLPLDEDPADWTEEADLENARWLSVYYGPGGIWWDVNAERAERSAAERQAGARRGYAGRGR